MAERKDPKKKKKTPKTYKGKSLKPGGGGRFAKLQDDLSNKYGTEGAAKIAAIAGRKKYGAKKMAGWSKKGKARAGKK